jgi:phosphatidylglycerophosphate synthase
MDRAILVAAGTGIEDECLSSHGSEVFGALPQIKRLVITAQRAGIKRFTIITEPGDNSLKDILYGERRIESEIRWHELGSKLPLDDGPSLILQSNLVTTPKALKSFIDTDGSEQEIRQDEVTVLVDITEDAWIKTENGTVSDIYGTGGRAVGAFIASGTLLNKAVTDSMSIKNLVQELVPRDKVKYKRFENGYWMRLDSEQDSPKRAEELIFTTVGKTATGWISRNINSRFSLPTSRLLVKTPLTPNMISVLINIIGSLCGVFYAIGHPVIGALCLHAATILDRCDGEVARVKLMETKKGEWVDTISDQFTMFSFIIGVPIGYYFTSNNPIALVLGGINVSIFVFFVIWSFYFLTRYTNSGSLVAYFEVDKLVEVKDTSFMRKLIKIVRPMGRRNVYSLGFLLLAIFGGYPWVLGATTLGAVMFLLHQLEDILKLRKINPDTNTLK